MAAEAAIALLLQGGAGKHVGAGSFGSSKRRLWWQQATQVLGVSMDVTRLAEPQEASGIKGLKSSDIGSAYRDLMKKMAQERRTYKSPSKLYDEVRGAAIE